MKEISNILLCKSKSRFGANTNGGNTEMPDAGNVISGILAVWFSRSLLLLCVVVANNKVSGEMEGTLGMSERLLAPSFTITGLP